MTVACCELCWQVFPSEMDLLRHEATEDDRLYDLDGPLTPVVGECE